MFVQDSKLKHASVLELEFIMSSMQYI